VTCSELGTLKDDSAEYLKLQFICRDRTIKITLFQLVLLLITVALFLIAVGCCAHSMRLKPSEVTVLVGASNSLRRNVRAGNNAQSEADQERMRELAKRVKVEKINKQLKTIKFDKIKRNTKVEEPESCCICVMEFTESEVIKLTPCKHMFHNDCLF
jgi:hypothetical protein